MHASTRILILLVAAGTTVGGWWILIAINPLVLAIIYGVLWTAVVLIATRVLFAVGFRFSRLTSGRGGGPTSGLVDAATALAELSDLRDRDLISAHEYDAKRARVLDRL